MRFTPEPGDIPIILLGRGFGLVELMVAALVRTTGWANGPGGGSLNLLPPGLSPAGVVRTVLLIPAYAAFGAAGAMDATGWAVDGGTVILVGVGAPVGLGGLAGSLPVRRLRR